jgi:hypothetical protein
MQGYDTDVSGLGSLIECGTGVRDLGAIWDDLITQGFGCFLVEAERVSVEDPEVALVSFVSWEFGSDHRGFCVRHARLRTDKGMQTHGGTSNGR